MVIYCSSHGTRQNRLRASDRRCHLRWRPPIHEIGCAGVITDVEELPGGRFNIVLRGLVKFRVTGEDDSRSYRLARIEAMPEISDDAEKAALRTQRQRLEALVTKGGDSKVSAETTDEELVNFIAQYLPMTHSQRQHLLELESVLLRARALIELIESKAAVTVPSTPTRSAPCARGRRG